MIEMTTVTLQDVHISPERCRSYRQHGRPETLRGALRQLRAIARDRDQLLACGDSEAVAGGTVLLRAALLDVVAVPCHSRAQHERKNTVVDTHFETVTAEAPWLVELMLVIAIRTEAEGIDLDPAIRQPQGID